MLQHVAAGHRSAKRSAGAVAIGGIRSVDAGDRVNRRFAGESDVRVVRPFAHSFHAVTVLSVNRLARPRRSNKVRTDCTASLLAS